MSFLQYYKNSQFRQYMSVFQKKKKLYIRQRSYQTFLLSMIDFRKLNISH